MNKFYPQQVLWEARIMKKLRKKLRSNIRWILISQLRILDLILMSSIWIRVENKRTKSIIIFKWKTLIKLRIEAKELILVASLEQWMVLTLLIIAKKVTNHKDLQIIHLLVSIVQWKNIRKWNKMLSPMLLFRIWWQLLNLLKLIYLKLHLLKMVVQREIHPNIKILLLNIVTQIWLILRKVRGIQQINHMSQVLLHL